MSVYTYGWVLYYKVQAYNRKSYVYACSLSHSNPRSSNPNNTPTFPLHHLSDLSQKPITTFSIPQIPISISHHFTPISHPHSPNLSFLDPRIQENELVLVLFA